MKTSLAIHAIAFTLAAVCAAQAQSPVPVTPDNFPRAESDLYFAKMVKDGAFAKFMHNREPTPIDKQTVIRMNRDTLYSSAVFDLDAGPVTVTLPNGGKRYMAMQVINQDEYTPMVIYKPGPVTLTRKNVGTRYGMALIRTLVDPNDPKDLEAVRKLQDAIKVTQKTPGKFEMPIWDEASHKKVKEALLQLATTLPSFRGSFGAKGDVNPIHHLIGAAAGWGGNPDKDAIYLGVTPANNDGKGVYKLTVKNVPVEGFWSISVYNGRGYFEQNSYNAYSVNDITAKMNPDGSVTVQFGGCDGKIPNCLPITNGWNYTVRLYRPKPEILNGKWKFPEAQAVN